jgi:hypothetical protein
MKSSENLSSADNQQERSKEFLRGYVTGLVDGEGSFHIAFATRNDLHLKISVIPEFHISQNSESIKALESVKKLLGCGYIKPNHNGSKDRTYVYVVRDRFDLLTKIIPFFEFNVLKTAKSEDFEKFSKIVRLMQSGIHQNSRGLEEIINLAYTMNGNGSHRQRSKKDLVKLLKSSTTICQSPDLAG